MENEEQVIPNPPASWVPKIGHITLLSETDKRTNATVVYPFIVDTVVDGLEEVRDGSGHIMTETVVVKTTSKGSIPVTRKVMRATKVYSGTIFASWLQYPQPRRGVKLADLSQPEV